MDDKVNALLQIFKEREKFILIGLTGRTGSGCTTAAELLSSSFKKFDLPKPKFGPFKNNDERKNRIIYSYSKKHWHPFVVISIKDVITSFVLEHDYSKFEKYVLNLVESTSVKADLKKEFRGKIKKHYDKLHNERLKIKSLNKNSRKQVNVKAKESFRFHFEAIPAFSRDLKKLLDKIELEKNEDSFTSTFQKLGNNVRASGSALDESFRKNKVYTLARRLNGLIKAIRIVQKE